MIILKSILFVIFITLSMFHFYWLFGCTWGLLYVVPTKNDSESQKPIPRFATFVVAVTLLFFGLIYIVDLKFISNTIYYYTYWFVPIIFIIRAIGDFNYVGFFKKIKHTKFAKQDYKLFSPLSLFIGLIGLIIQALKYF